MGAFLLSVLRNLLVGLALALLSAMLYRQKDPDPPEPEENDFKPTATEGTEVKQLFGTGPVEMVVVAVVDRATTPIRV